MILQTIHNFITSGYKPEYEYKYFTVLLFAAEFKTHSWVYYLGRRLADPTTRRQLTGHTLRRNRRRGLQNGTQETRSQGAFHPQTLY